MNDEIERIHDPDADEGWQRLTDESEIRDVDAYRDGEDGWQLGVAVLEFIREDPLETELREALMAAARAVPGVVDIEEEDRETFTIEGSPSGEALVRAVAEVLDRFADRNRAHIDSL